MGQTVTLSLVSHTNVGKTTLARTLLRREIGEVLDQAHVTESNEAHTIIEADGHTLRIWDTPGFGDTARLMKRLRQHDEPIGWFMHQVWDRVVDRPQWCNQKAMENIQTDADVVLYLVNASEEPEDAGYIPLELELLTWIGRPVLLLLNQVGHADESDVEKRWRDFVGSWPIVTDVLPLDAFTRSWTEEGTMFARVIDMLEGDKRTAMQALTTAWNTRHLEIFRRSCTRMAALLASTAIDQEVPNEPIETTGNKGAVDLLANSLKFSAIDKKHAMNELSGRLEKRMRELMEQLIADHGLVGVSEARIAASIAHFEVKGRVPINERSGAVAGAIVSGALSGLTADILVGGLSFGAGALAGGVVGAIGGMALARGYRLVGGHKEPSVRWAPFFLDRLYRTVLVRYLAVAHYGRGRGDYRDVGQHAEWESAIEAAFREQRSRLAGAWKTAESSGDDVGARVEQDLKRVVEDSTQAVLRDAYPRARDLLR